MQLNGIIYYSNFSAMQVRNLVRLLDFSPIEYRLDSTGRNEITIRCTHCIYGCNILTKILLLTMKDGYDTDENVFLRLERFRF